jgi:septal ring factor EnvC (AmiA/AmiB activator)
MTEQKDTWGDYSKLVLKELERLNDNYDKMRSDMDSRFSELNNKLTEVKNVEKSVITQNAWIEKVNDVWSPSQMKEAKDEIYRQKNRWVAAIAIITFIQIAVGVIISIWGKL